MHTSDSENADRRQTTNSNALKGIKTEASACRQLFSTAEEAPEKEIDTLLSIPTPPLQSSPRGPVFFIGDRHNS
jgi:hypothetical protein